MNIHPYIRRIRAERRILRCINQQRALFGSELAGLSAAALDRWLQTMPGDVKASLGKDLASRLYYVGRLTKLSSNGSHRGAMLAPPPNEAIVAAVIDELTALLTPLESVGSNAS